MASKNENFFYADGTLNLTAAINAGHVLRSEAAHQALRRIKPAKSKKSGFGFWSFNLAQFAHPVTYFRHLSRSDEMVDLRKCIR